MRTLGRLAGVIVGASMGTAAFAGAPPQPQVIEAPDAAQASAAYPEQAPRARVSGQARLSDAPGAPPDVDPEAGFSGPPPGLAPVGGMIDPAEAIQAAAAAAPSPVLGVFTLRVRASGADARGVYLNSEADYRDQRNLTVALSFDVARRLRALYGAEPGDHLRGKRIAVRGAARRVRIDFRAGGQRTGLFYYQTHVDVVAVDQIRVLN